MSLAKAKRVVVKIGSALLVDEETGAVRRRWLDALADDVAALRKDGVQVALVTSGAIAVGRRHLKLARRVLKLEEKQAAAATGQIRLAHAYQEALARHGITVAQILVTLDDTEERRRYLNARSTIETLFRFGAIPLINENDTVATEEIRFGDNDRLAARIAQMASADALVLLSDIDGLYTEDPRNNPRAEHIPLVHEITPEIEAMAGVAPPGYSSGGMVTKLAAGKIALAAGCRMAIAPGRAEHALAQVAGEPRRGSPRCTWFVPNANPRAARKQWIAGALNPRAAITADDGAIAALRAGKSLLPAGVKDVTGDFQRGDAVIIKDTQGRRIGAGLIAYSAADARQIAGHKSREIAARLGYRGRDEMIHRDDLVLD